MDIRLVFLLFIGTVIYFVYFYHGRRTNTKSTTKKKKKRHGKKQAAEPQENNSSTTQSHKIDSTTNKPANEETARSAVSSVAYSKQTHTSNTSVKSNDNVQVNIKAKEAATNQTEADSTSDAIDTSNTKRKNKKSSSHQQQKRNAQQQQFDADFPALPTKTYQEDNDMLPEEKSPVYARVLRITAPEKEKKEQISGARRQRAIAGPDGWFTVKTVAEASIPRTTQPPKKDPADDDGLTKRQRANRRRAELNKEEKELQRLEQQRRLMNHRIAQAKALYK